MNKLGLFFLITVLILPVRSEAEEQGCDQVLARILSIQGTVEKKQLEAHEWIRIENGSLLCANETVRTLKRSRATVEVINETIVSLDENTTLLFSKEEDDSLYAWLADLFTGKIFLRSREPHRLKVNTPFINAAHEGTEFMVTVDDEKGSVLVFDGQVAADNQFGKVTVQKGQQAIAFEGQAPQIKPIKISPEDAVQWMLYYSPILDDDAAPASPGSRAYFNQQAATLLNLGRVEEAQAAIDQAKLLKPDNANSLALEAVIAVAKNRADQALSLSSRAVKKDPQSAAARIAHSYALQAKFKLEDALQTMEQAVKNEPNHAIAWARLAELQLSMGDQDSALTSAQTAEKLNPTLGRTQIILGFADLAQVDIDEAKQAFEQAIQLDSTDPLARLGLGLAKIRQGDVEEGTRDMEAAVSLDPDNAVMRSYLGKAYYELKNTSYATTELAIAKEKDPKDPTPWFYDAILKQTTNRPVEALHDMQKAIELNDNRAVYRSSLLLDEDLAARSASLGRIYNDLDFQQLGLVQGWRSVNADPGNYSAHRLLADNYAVRPRHEIARVSELLQSQLLQPINVTPVQPQLAQNNLLILDGLGPASPSFNEFNPLFARNRLALQASGLLGGNNTWGNEVVQSGLWNKFSYSLGQFHYETDGYRKNNFVGHDIYNVFIQGRLASELSLQAEYKHEERSIGDVKLNFQPENFSEKFKEDKEVDTYRLGGLFNFSQNSKILGSMIYQKVDIDQHTLFPGIKNTTSRKGFIGELQNQYKFNSLNIISGFSHINQDVIQNIFGEKQEPDITNTTLYSYWQFKPWSSLITTLGLSINFFKINNLVKHNPINPKFGLLWKPIKSTTFRIAAFRQSSMTRTANQTIEPTQIGGFNQLFDDGNGTDAWRYGVAIDHIFSSSVYAGIEYSERRLNELVENDFHGFKEQIGRAYLYVTPNSNIALRLDYEHEQFDRSNHPLDGIVDVRSHKLPISLSFFSNSGASFRIKGTYVNQSGNFSDQNNKQIKGSDSFFLVDANINFRLPARYGIFSLGINNIFNKNFQYQNTSRVSPLFVPERFLFCRFTLAF